MSERQLDCALDLMRRLPPQRVERHLSQLIDLQPDLCEDLLSSVDQPLKIAKDKLFNKDYLLCDYNRDGDSYRSCWSGKYDPPLEDGGAVPSDGLRQLEVALNDAFDEYRTQYFEGGVSSVYLWDMDDGFAGVLLVKKSSDGSRGIRGCWDSIHVIEVTERPQMKTASYKLTSTIMLWLQTTTSKAGLMNLGGSLTRVYEKKDQGLFSKTKIKYSSEDEKDEKERLEIMRGHVKNIGTLVETMENRMRCSLSEIYFSKTRDIVNACRSVNTLVDEAHKKELSADIHRRIMDKSRTAYD